MFSVLTKTVKNSNALELIVRAVLLEYVLAIGVVSPITFVSSAV